MTTDHTIACPICNGKCLHLDSIDFNRSCEEQRGTRLPDSGVLVQYVICERCRFSFAPQLYRWTLDEFAARIYNQDYAIVDPDYIDARPRANARALMGMFGDSISFIRHLDFGGGNGLLSELLREAGFQSASYDPFVDRDVQLADFGKFDLITAFEVFEHVPDPVKLAADLASFLDDTGMILFSTLLSDGNVEPSKNLTWWYAGPRNGHISLFSRDSLFYLARRQGFQFGSFSPNLHAFWNTVPEWGRHLLRQEAQCQVSAR